MSDQEQSDQLSPDEMRAPGGGGRPNKEPTGMTTWDGAGNPIKHVLADDEDGHLSEGTGPDAQKAAEDAADSSHVLGDDVTPQMESEGKGSGEPLG